jgi:hypothetical protein
MFINVNPEHAEEWADLFSARVRAFRECFEAVKKELPDNMPLNEVRIVTMELIYDANDALSQKHEEYKTNMFISQPVNFIPESIGDNV